MKHQDAALVCFSGGQDSTTCLFWAKKHFKRVEAVCFTYGQKHSLEIDIARKIAADADVPFQLLDVSLISQLAPNSLTDTSIEMDEDKPADSYPNTFVPGRNMVFLTFAAIMARSKGIFHLVTGVSEADFSGYPDCRDTFVRSLNVTLNLAMDEQFVIHTPLMDRDKSEVWQLSDELGVFDLVRTQTLTCYNGVPADGCGHCPACKLRREGLEKYLKRKLTANKQLQKWIQERMKTNCTSWAVLPNINRIMPRKCWKHLPTSIKVMTTGYVSTAPNSPASAPSPDSPILRPSISTIYPM